MVHESGVEWFPFVYAHGAYLTDSIKPRCDRSRLLLRPKNINMCSIFRTAQVPKNRQRFRHLWRRDRAVTDPYSGLLTLIITTDSKSKQGVFFITLGFTNHIPLMTTSLHLTLTVAPNPLTIAVFPPSDLHLVKEAS